MGKKMRIWIKLMLAALLAVLLIWLIYTDENILQLEQPIGELVLESDVKILVSELIEAGVTEIDETALEEFWKKHPNENVEGVNYSTYQELITCLLKEEKDTEFYRQLLFERKYRDEFLLLKSDWYDKYQKLLIYYGLGDVIKEETVTILCGGDKVVGEQQVEGEKLLVATGQIMEPVSQELRTMELIAVKTYVHENRLLTLVQKLSDVSTLNNVWIMESDEERLQFFFEGYEICIGTSPFGTSQELREQVADIEYGNGNLNNVRVKSEKIGGKILSLDSQRIEIESHGSYEFSEDCVGYQLYDKLRKAEMDELLIGYDFSDFVFEDGKICAFLITKKEKTDTIRVVIKNSETGGIYHEQIALDSSDTLSIQYGDYAERTVEKILPGNEFVILKDSDYLSGDRVEVSADINTGKIKVLSQNRAQGVPAYRGSLEIVKAEEGLVLINEISLEEYLYSVVPSEMPASYPIEALKAQVICARTYGYGYIIQPGYKKYGAHVDDSVGYQVYNNIAENVESTRAVKETAGTVMCYGEEMVNAYYYSTSCGYGSDAGVWSEAGKEQMPYLQAKHIAEPEEALDTLSDEEEFEKYILNLDETAFEKEEPWFRWEYQVDKLDISLMFERLGDRYKASPEKILFYKGKKDPKDSQSEFESKEPEKFKKIYDITCIKRGAGGVMDEILVETDKGTYKIISEYNIRYVLNQRTKVIKQDGSEYESASLLPSAYIIINTVKSEGSVIGYTIFGGGYGHGVGMSQNGARAMGNKGMGFEEILLFYFEGCQLKNIYTSTMT